MTQRNNARTAPPVEPQPPQDVAAEQAVLGSLLIDGDTIAQVEPLLTAADFYREHHGWIYAACLALTRRGDAINEITVGHELAEHNRLSGAGGLEYLAELTVITPTSVHAAHYARIVADMALRRRMITVGAQIAQIGYEGGAEGMALLERASELLTGLAASGTAARAGFTHIREVIGHYITGTMLRDRPTPGEPQARLATGYPALDSLLGGLHRSDLVIVAARPGVGKSALALGFARNAALRERAHVAVFSLEMSNDQLVERLLAAEAAVDVSRLRTGGHRNAELAAVLDAAGKLADAEILMADTPTVTLAEMRARSLRLHAERPLDLLIVDYLQLIDGGGRGRNRVEQITEISRGLKGLARELNVPVIAMSQLSRAVENRQPHLPMLSDLRESGSIEQDADVVMFIHREEMYHTEEAWYQQFPTQQYPKGIARIIVAKHRHGPTGERALFFRAEHTRFDSLAWEWEP